MAAWVFGIVKAKLGGGGGGGGGGEGRVSNERFSAKVKLKELLTKRLFTYRCVPCVKIKDTDDVLPVKEGPQLP